MQTARGSMQENALLADPSKEEDLVDLKVHIALETASARENLMKMMDCEV
jgi:hypothetical protein